MNNRLKYPLSIFVVWHPNFIQGKEIANNLYSTFCRDIKEPLSRGLGIPVYYRSLFVDKVPIPVQTTNANRNAIVLLIDQQYMIDDGFRAYTETLAQLVDDNTRVYPVALCEQSYGIGCNLEKLQFIRAYHGDLSVSENLQFSLKKIRSEMLHDCARLMMNMQPIWMDYKTAKTPSPVKLFLSHAKKDGLVATENFKAFIEKETKLDVFFDTVDVADGYDFEKQFEDQIKNSALVVFHTDEYSSREWCRIEVLIAKRNKCSIVVVHDIKNGEKRAFPYLGNTPTITMQSDEESSFYEIVNLTLLQVLNNLFQLQLLQIIQSGYEQEGTEFISITSPPELFNYIDILKKKVEVGKKLVILYPEPPLGAEELRILNEIDAEIKFITPISLPTL
ncbi:toll/interleukin-1 receptor domain-containing protein [Ferruginibacter paludis]|uniref:toll/interleukin-1 receptor domain-containing protein n=1 Tax=Ferruginibacter paludis TaxID=1310417 RepID=UPI0025B3DD99|nr:toll/interleukin-1 receptor domain-containing protein [Ferruginibacter paludis]MDN3657832.1 toll/interleukin-1 receptor domain-containing protein [Ferruginibacter paludis]